MKKLSVLVGLFACLIAVGQNAINDSTPIKGRWSKKKINKWHKKLPWLVGCNYYPATAINQIEMWQSSTWDPETINKELGWAEAIGMNTLRVYLHNLVWEDDEEGLYQRMDEFLDICQRHKIRPWFVFFDDCHYPNPKLGPQPLPVPRYHNSGWVNSPAREVALRYAQGKATLDEVAALKGYVQKTLFRFKDDERVLLWELYNEPGRGNGELGDLPGEKKPLAILDNSKKLVYDSWVWAREISPSQPITSTTEGSLGKTNIKINRINSDVYSIHSYDGIDDLKNKIMDYKKDGRPIIVSEWLARTHGSTVESYLPFMKEMNVGAVNWGFVSGKSATIWPWHSRKTKSGIKRSLIYEREIGHVIQPGEQFPEPKIWHHDLFRIDGTAYDPKEIELFKKLTKDVK